MDMSLDFEDSNSLLRPAKRPKRSRNEEHMNRERNLNSQEIGIMRGSHDLNRGSRFVGSSSGIHFIRTVYGMLSGSCAPTLESEDTTSPVVPGEDDELLGDGPESLTGSTKRTISDKNLWTSNEIGFGAHGRQTPNFEDLIESTKTYFENWHPIFPFLHAPSVLEVFERVSNNGLNSATAADKVIIRALVSIGVADGRQSITKPAPPSPDFVFINVEQVMLDVQFAICQPATLHNLQALFAAQLFLVSMLKFNFASRIGGTVVRMAFHLGLHRCPSRYGNFSALENELRRRMFFCVYCLDRILCQSLGLPLGISDSDIDVCYPGEESHGPSARDQTRFLEENSHLVTLCMFARHARIRGMILELRNKSLHSRHETGQRALGIEMELSKWSNMLHELVDESVNDPNSSADETCSISRLHRTYLLLLEHESTIALNRPLVTANKSSTNAMSALQTCIRASRTTIAILDEYRSVASRAGKQLMTPITWPLATWCCWMSFFILAFAALEGKSTREFAVKYAEKSLQILNHLSLRKTRWPDLCADAVRHVRMALIKTPGGENGAGSAHTRGSSPGRHNEHASSGSRNLRITRDGPPERPMIAQERSLSTTSHIPSNDTTLIQHNLWSLPNYPVENHSAEFPGSINAPSGRFEGFNFDPTSLKYGANDVYQESFDPFSAIDFSNFAMTNFNLMNDFGPYV